MITGIKKKRGLPYWYKIHLGECPVCGSQSNYRERVYGPRPKRSEDRYHYLPYTETYDHCED